MDAEVDVSWQRQVDDIVCVLDHFSLHRARLCGYSFGGLLCQLLATRHPDRIDCLVLASSAPPSHGYREPLRAALARAQSDPGLRAERQALDRSGFRQTHPAEYRRRRFALSVAGYFADRRLAHGLTPFLVQSRVAEAIADSLEDSDRTAEVAGALPGDRTLFVHGKDDPIGIDFLRDVATQAGARFEAIAGVGHVPYVEAPGTFFAIVRAFLNDMKELP